MWRCVDEDGDVSLTAGIVHEFDNDPVPTGVLDSNGVEIWSIEERNPIGFRLTR